ncbi:DUF4349 domain-containing protein [Microbacterium sp. HD4P20]|uniref:DUF4349 domain-containing protein n=1 Tax=Microbacterium sp. HD4P20 TaxID=2864874 RepID=UPI001C63CDF0|nr:DUF4349 domain-containing protein [Microbacterium sp. HD4P20]MCP2636643.1 DUF4349 domain-containing protein [Microbacterium sp. HD4P20]
MNTQQPDASAPLPELSAERVDDLEKALFADIARERDVATARRARRGRLWIVGGAAAGVIAVAAIIAPTIGPLVSGSNGASSDTATAPFDQPGGAEPGGGLEGPVELDAQQSDQDAVTESTARDDSLADGAADRDIITTASATVTVEDVESAARTIGQIAVAQGGYVESMNISADASTAVVDPSSGVAYDTMPYPYPYPPGDTWITVRVPADQLTTVVDELAEIGDVTASSVNRQDVTEQTVDLAARIEAAQASVERLMALMAQAESVADLIAAESALSERQSMLESYQQQLEMLESQVAMSTLTVTLTPETEPVVADPAGFGDGVVAGWNGLVATLNGIVVAFGFLLPWLGVAAIAALIVWGIVRLVRRRRERRRDAAARRPSADTRPETPGEASE